VGIDLAKRVMQVCVLNGSGSVIAEKRLPRDRLADCVAAYPGSIVAMEACGGAHHWGRQFAHAGHEVRLLPPYLVKAYRDPAQKDDRRDARATAEAGSRPHVRPVPVKSAAAQAVQCLERAEQLLARQRTQTGNALRGLLAEYGIVLPKGPGMLKQRLPELMMTPAWAELACELRAALDDLFASLLEIDRRLERAKERLAAVARTSAAGRNLLSVPGIGPLTTAGLLASMGDPARFGNGRQFAAWLGLTPKRQASGETDRLGRITKRGNERLRTLFVNGAQSMMRRYREGRHASDPLARWARQLLRRKNWNVAVVALANKQARIAWRIMASNQPYQPRTV
jgi:transposase